MEIIRGSVQDIDQDNSVLENLSLSMSYLYCVSIYSRIFMYELQDGQDVDFTIKEFQDVFYDWKDGEFYTKKKVAGSIDASNYADSQNQVFFNFSHDSTCNSLDKVAKHTNVFWQEVTAHFTLPPTHVYVHIPVQGSVFDEGIFWQFCYIYLNNNTKQGIVLSAHAFD